MKTAKEIFYEWTNNPKDCRNEMNVWQDSLAAAK